MPRRKTGRICERANGSQEPLLHLEAVLSRRHCCRHGSLSTRPAIFVLDGSGLVWPPTLGWPPAVTCLWARGGGSELRDLAAHVGRSGSDSALLLGSEGKW